MPTLAHTIWNRLAHKARTRLFTERDYIRWDRITMYCVAREHRAITIRIRQLWPQHDPASVSEYCTLCQTLVNDLGETEANRVAIAAW